MIIVLFCIIFKRINLQDVSDRLKDRYEIVWTALQHNGDKIQYVSARLKNNPCIMLLAMQKNIKHKKFASPYLKSKMRYYTIRYKVDELNAMKMLANEEQINAFVSKMVVYDMYFIFKN